MTGVPSYTAMGVTRGLLDEVEVLVNGQSVRLPAAW